MRKKKIFIDTDICDDIDDLWALILALNIPAIEVVGISVSNGNTIDKARFVCKLLTELDKTNIPVYIGKSTSDDINNHLEYIGEYSLKNYPGMIYKDFQSIKRLFMMDEDIIIIGLGPVTNIQDMCEIFPGLINYKFILMGGAFYKGYLNQKNVAEEFNVIMDIPAFRFISAKFKDLVIAPLDVCRDIVIDGDYYQKLLKSNKEYIKVLLKNYMIWYHTYAGGSIKFNYKESSTILYDLIPILYCVKPELFVSERTYFNVLDNGITEVNSHGVYNASTLINITNRDKLYQIINDYLLLGELN